MTMVKSTLFYEVKLIHLSHVQINAIVLRWFIGCLVLEVKRRKWCDDVDLGASGHFNVTKVPLDSSCSCAVYFIHTRRWGCHCRRAKIGSFAIQLVITFNKNLITAQCTCVINFAEMLSQWWSMTTPTSSSSQGWTTTKALTLLSFHVFDLEQRRHQTLLVASLNGWSTTMPTSSAIIRAMKRPMFHVHT